jgi:hypothetical protein
VVVVIAVEHPQVALPALETVSESAELVFAAAEVKFAAPVPKMGTATLEVL